MDDSGSWSEASSAEASLPPSGKKAKGKAPRPPGEARYSDSLPSFDLADTVQYNMDQKENIIDRDIELKVVLPGDRVTTTIVNGSKPMMDLLVYLCGQYRLNPSTYTIDLIAADKSQLKFKPNTPIGILEVESVVLKSKNADERNKKSGPTMPEQTVRLVINYRRTQKTVMRVSPLISLQDLIPSICSKCEFDPRSTLLLHDYESQKPLDLSRSLNDLGIRELYALDPSKATTPTSPTGFRPPPLQESCQNMEIKQNDDKRFFSFFRRSTKKKRDQTNSAPATPLLNKTRPPNVTRENAVTQSYDSNTMPSDVPKKRRAPLPPMYPPHNDITRGPMRTASCVVKSISAEERTVPGFDLCRTGSFQHSMTSSRDSTLQRTKRKAPLPPSSPTKALQDSGNESSNDLVVSEEINNRKSDEENHLHMTSATGTHISPSPVSPRVTYTVALVLESEVQEHEEKEELNVALKGEASSSYEEEAANGSTKEETCLASAKEHAEENTAASDTVVASETYSSLDAAENTIKMSEVTVITNGTSNRVTTEETGAESITLEVGREAGEREIRTSVTELENHQMLENNTVVTEQASQTVSYEQTTDTTHTASPQDSHAAHVETEVSVTQASAEKGKTQDSAVQTVNFDNDAEERAEKELENSQDYSYSVSLGNSDSFRHELNGHTIQQSPVYEQKGFTGKDQNRQEHISSLRESVETQTFAVQENVVESSQSNSYQLYRQHSEPKPVSSNELTRDYLPKIGLTTYKIVPQRLYDVERYVESESSHDAQNSIYSSASDTEISHTVTNNNVTSSLGPISEKDELLNTVKNGNHSPQAVSPTSTVGNQLPQAVSPPGAVTKTVADPSRKNILSSTSILKTDNATTNFAFTRSLSSASILKTDNTTLPEIKTKQSSTSPIKGPSSFYLQMQRRASSMYVTSAIAKAKPSINATNSTVKLKDLGKEASQVTIKTLPSRLNVLNMSTSVEESKQVDTSVLTERPSEVKNGDPLSVVGNNISRSQSYTETDSKAVEVPSKVSTKVSLEHHKHVSFEDQRTVVPSSETTSVFPVASCTEIKSQMVHHEYQPDVVSTSKTVRPLSSPTGQSVPLSLQKLRDFATPRPFLGTNPNSFPSAGTFAVKRSQSFSSGTSPVKQPLNIDAPIGWSPVSSPSESKMDYSLFSVNSQERAKNQTLTPELKYRVHSPPPVPEKKTAVSFQGSDPEHLRQNILATIRSGEAAANLKRITIRSNTISVNGRARIGHPVFSETLPEM